MPIIQSEVSQREKDKHCILILYIIYKYYTDELNCRTTMETYREQVCGHGSKERGNKLREYH